MANPNQEIKYTKLFINNEYVDAVSKKTFATINPANEKKIADIAEGDKADVELAVIAAKNAFKRGSNWRNLDNASRAQLIIKLGELIHRDVEILANLEALDTGKPYIQAMQQVYYSGGALKSYASWTDKMTGKTLPSDGPLFSYTRKEPIGVVGQIIAWNYPLLIFVVKVGPVLAAGCTVVIKAAEQTPLTALYMGSLIKEAGFPPGVINIIAGYGPTAGAAISSHPDIRKVAFTGSTEVGKLIMEAAAKSNLKKVSLELGGKSPLVVFDDVDVDEVAPIAVEAIFTNSGQICIASSRTFVQEKIYDKFVAKCIEIAKKRKIGSQFEAGVEYGPQVDKDTFDKALTYIQYGIDDGAKLETGGKRWGSEGFFIEPTIFSGVTDNMRIAKDEIFGPVMSILKFKDREEVIDRANNTEYGLAACVFSKDIENSLAFANQVEAGLVRVNTTTSEGGLPFGGYKQSGIGREGGEYGVDLYLETKAVTVKMPYKM